MKKLLSIILAGMMIFSICAMPSLADEATDVFADEIKITVDGKAVDCNAYGQMPVIVKGRTLVPLRAVFEALGATVEWNNDTRTVTSIRGDVSISLAVDSTELYVNGKAKTIDVPAQIMSDRTMVPVRAVAEAFGCYVEWNNDTRTVVVLTTVENENEMKAAEKTVSNMYEAVKAGDLYAVSNYCVEGVGINGLSSDMGFMAVIMSTIGVYTGSLSEEQQERYAYASAELLAGLLKSVTYEIVSSEVISENRVAVVVNLGIADVASLDMDKIVDGVETELSKEMQEEFGYSPEDAKTMEDDQTEYMNEYNVRGFERLFATLAQAFPNAAKSEIPDVSIIVEKIDGKWLIVE